MYKVYLSPSTQDKSFGVEDFGVEEFRMNQIADEVEKELLKRKKYVVYRNKTSMNKEDIIEDSNNLNVDVHIAIHSYYGKRQGPECYTQVGSEVSNGFAKSIYQEVNKTYYDKNIDNGIFYDESIVEIMKVKRPAVLVQIGCHENKEDVNWIIKNTKKIGIAIANGIEKGFKLKPC